MHLFRLASTALSLLLFIAFAPGALAQDASCNTSADCRSEQSCVENRCWDLSDGVPSRCVGYVEGGTTAQCRTMDNWEETALTDCSAAGGELEDQLHGDSCGDGTFRTTLSLCCVPVNTGGDVISGVNVRQLRERLKDKFLEEHLGCSSGDSGAPVAPALLIVLALLAVRRRS